MTTITQLIKRLLSWFRPRVSLNRYAIGDTFETHECILCKHDPDASYCIPEPKDNGL